MPLNKLKEPKRHGKNQKIIKPMTNDNPGISKTEAEFYQREKKKIQPSPDISQMQMVQIDENTTIYIAADASAEEARTRFENYRQNRKVAL